MICNVEDVMQRRKSNVLCIQEMVLAGQGARQLGDSYKVLYSDSKNKRNGVGVISDPEWKVAVVDGVRHNDRLIQLY